MNWTYYNKDGLCVPRAVDQKVNLGTNKLNWESGFSPCYSSEDDLTHDTLWAIRCKMGH